MLTRLVSRASAAVVVHASNTLFWVGSGTVWKWSNSQIESHDPASAAFATAVIASHCSTGSAISVRSIRQPCGTKIPNRVVMTVSLVHHTDRHHPVVVAAQPVWTWHRPHRLCTASADQAISTSSRSGDRAGGSTGVGLDGHHALVPSSTRIDGSITIRISVASISTATARPIPICFISTIDRVAKIANTETMTAAALVTTPAVLDTPARTASRGDSPRRTPSRTRLRTNTW